MAVSSGDAHGFAASTEEQQHGGGMGESGRGSSPSGRKGQGLPFRQRFPWMVGLAWILMDSVCIIAALYVAIFVTNRKGTDFYDALWARSGYLVAFLVSWFVAAMDQRLLVSRRNDDLVPQLSAITKAFLTALVTSVLLMGIFGRGRLGREFLLVFGLGTLALVLAYRTVFRLNIWRLRFRGWSTSRVVIVGANETAVYLVKLLRAHEQYGYQVDGFVEDTPARIALMTQMGVPHLGTVDSLEHLLVKRVVDAVFIALPVRSFYETIQRVAHLCEGVGVPVRFVADLFPFQVAPNRMWRLEGIPLLSLSKVPRIEPRRLIQRGEDVIISSLLIGMLMPAMLLVALSVKLASRGPVLEPQNRVCRDGRHFRMYRFRCKEMAAVGASEPGVERRFTRLGAYLFRYDIDELPVLFNVWLGHMSLAEPKPPLADGPRDTAIGLERGARSSLSP